MNSISHARRLLGTVSLLGALFASGLQADDIKIGPVEIIRQGDRHPADLVLIGRDLRMETGATNRDVVVVLGDADIDGTVEGNLVVVLGKVRLGAHASIEREMVLAGGELNRHPDAKFAGFEGVKIALPPLLVTALQDWIKKGLMWGRPLPHDRLWAWWLFGVLVVFYLFVGLLMPAPVQACSRTLATRPLSSFLAGLLATLLLGPLILILAASVVGSLAIPFFLCGALAALILGQAGLNACVGGRIQRQTRWTWLQSPAAELAVGTLLVGLVFFVPVFGLLAWGIICILGLGAAVLGFLASLKSETRESADGGAPPLSVPRSPGPGLSSNAAMEEEPLVLPRAGFWIRLAATLLDLILIGVLVNLIAANHPQRYFLLVWFLYHFLMWGWFGSTMGGLVLGLKIFKQNGDPLGFANALVRCMAAFFSALVLFLGFFWTGWNREKLSWHDIIAGTVIAKCPRGTVLA